MTFAQSIRQLRQSRHLTQRLAAERCGVTTVTFWNWEKGRSTPWPKDQARHLAALGGEIPEWRENAAKQLAAMDAAASAVIASKRHRIIDNLGELEP